MVSVKALDYKDVSLISRVVSNIKSRDECDTTSSICGLELSLPIIASPMVDVCDGNFAKLMSDYGGVGIIHRFSSIEEQVAEVNKVAYSKENIKDKVVCAIGLDQHERLATLYNIGVKIFCLDIAMGANYRVEKFLSELGYKDVKFIVGNVCSGDQFAWLQKLPLVKAVRVGVGSGKACRTSNVTGIYHPMISLIRECAERQGIDIAIIADGGITSSADMCKAIAFGANAVMMGSVLANTIESPAKIINLDGKQYKSYSGSASEVIQKMYKEEPAYIEGTTVLLEYKKTILDDIFNSYGDGLQSSMSYVGARTLEEYRNNTSWVQV